MKIQSFKYPEIKKEDREYQFGSVDPVINPSGDWRPALTPFESQLQNGVEPSSCYVEAQLSGDASLKEFLYGIKDENYSARFNALLSGGTPTGGDPLKGAYSLKKDGAIPQAMMDWQGVESWQDFHSWKGVLKDECISKGQQEAREWDKKYKILSEKGDDIKDKYAKLKDGMTRYVCMISVVAWFERDGKYYKPKGYDDTHLVQALYVDKDNQITVKDTYFPYLKVLEANTNFDFAMGRILRKRSPQEILKDTQKSLIVLLYEFLAKLIKNSYRVGSEIVSELAEDLYGKRR